MVDLGITQSEMDTWHRTYPLYDPKPFTKVFQLEFSLLGRCPLLDSGDICGNQTIKCQYITQWVSWRLAWYCGPRLIKRYNIPKIKEKTP